MNVCLFVCLYSMLSSKASDMQYKLNDLVEESAKVGLKLNSVKTKSLKAKTSNTSSLATKLWTIQIPSPIFAWMTYCIESAKQKAPLLN